MKIATSQFDFALPEKLIAQAPVKPRDHSRLLILNKKTKQIEHKQFFNIVDYLKKGDVLVLNNSQVIPARLLGQKESGGKIEIFLLQKQAKKVWQCLIRGKVTAGQKIILSKNIVATIGEQNDNQTRLVSFNANDRKIFFIGETPLPPYIKDKSHSHDYQTVFAKKAGSVAAPTAGLHFTKKLLAQLNKKGVQLEYVTLHVGLGTFLPVKEKFIQNHVMHAEFVSIDKATAKRLNVAKKAGKRIVAVGTTSVRTLEACTEKGQIRPKSGFINIFIYPGYKFKFVEAIITNFHLPQSTLLMLISAFSDLKTIKSAYRQAVKNDYRFYSFGDAMFIY